ncbi:hypothetical protein [Streptomyces sp. NPDC056527]|uniref:hypothetical protein n=1 Tax=Streptomyces sp. NPDC056527 TaxID=3345853 RepID=UPI0036D0A3B6
MSHGRSGTGHTSDGYQFLDKDPGDRFILMDRLLFGLGMVMFTLGTAMMIWGLFHTPTAATTTLGAAEAKSDAVSQVREAIGTAADLTGLLSFYTGWRLGRRARRGDSGNGPRH